MKRDEILDRWRLRLADWSKLQTTVNGERIATEVLADLKAMAEAHDDAEVGLKGASEESGYSVRQLSRMVQDGTLTNVGRPHAPKLLRSQLPRRAAIATPDHAGVSLHIARQAVTSKAGQRRRGNGTEG